MNRIQRAIYKAAQLHVKAEGQKKNDGKVETMLAFQLNKALQEISDACSDKLNADIETIRRTQIAPPRLTPPRVKVATTELETRDAEAAVVTA